MRTLLDQDMIEELISIARARADDHRESLRKAIFATYEEGGTPPGFARLKAGSTDRRLVEQTVLKHAEQEQRGVLPGQLNSDMARHPEFRRMVAEDITGAASD